MTALVEMGLIKWKSGRICVQRGKILAFLPPGIITMDHNSDAMKQYFNIESKPETE